MQLKCNWYCHMAAYAVALYFLGVYFLAVFLIHGTAESL